MKLALVLAIISSLVLAGFLLIRPLLGGMGSATGLNTTGRAATPQPPGISLSNSTPLPPTRGGPAHKPTDADASAAGIRHLQEVEQIIVELTNLERQKAGARPLTVDDLLRRTARGHSDDMIYRAFFDHVNPDGLDSASRIAITHRRLVARMTGENIAAKSGNDGSDPKKIAHDMMYLPKVGWMNSPGHRENILKPEYTHVGVGVSIRGSEIRATQNFAQTVAFTDQPIPLQAARSDSINLGATTPEGLKADKYDLWIADRGLRADEPRSVTNGALNVQPGLYKLRFYFQDGKIYQGPQIEVR